MKKKGQILFIEDDTEDQEVFAGIFSELKVSHEIRFFQNCTEVLDFLYKSDEYVFLIFSDINLPGMSGIELRRVINSNDFLRKKAIPFVFFTTTATKETVDSAYELMVQGYFEKPVSYREIKAAIKTIIDYWSIGIHPNTL